MRRTGNGRRDRTHRWTGVCSPTLHVGQASIGGDDRRGGLARRRRDRCLRRTSGFRRRRPSRFDGQGESRPRAQRHPSRRLRVSRAPDHRQPGAGRRAQERRELRPADRPRTAGRHRRPAAPAHGGSRRRRRTVSRRWGAAGPRRAPGRNPGRAPRSPAGPAGGQPPGGQHRRAGRPAPGRLAGADRRRSGQRRRDLSARAGPARVEARSRCARPRRRPRPAQRAAGARDRSGRTAQPAARRSSRRRQDAARQTPAGHPATPDVRRGGRLDGHPLRRRASGTGRRTAGGASIPGSTSQRVRSRTHRRRAGAIHGPARSASLTTASCFSTRSWSSSGAPWRRCGNHSRTGLSESRGPCVPCSSLPASCSSEQ